MFFYICIFFSHLPSNTAPPGGPHFDERCLNISVLFSLVQECFDSKPRIISKRSKENLAVCSNLTARHPFDDNKWVNLCASYKSTFSLKQLQIIWKKYAIKNSFFLAYCSEWLWMGPAGAWSMWWGQPTCVTVRFGLCTRSASLTSVATRFATAASARTAAPSLTLSSSSNAGFCSRILVHSTQEDVSPSIIHPSIIHSSHSFLLYPHLPLSLFLSCSRFIRPALSSSLSFVSFLWFCFLSYFDSFLSFCLFFFFLIFSSFFFFVSSDCLFFFLFLFVLSFLSSFLSVFLSSSFFLFPLSLLFYYLSFFPFPFSFILSFFFLFVLSFFPFSLVFF